MSLLFFRIYHNNNNFVRGTLKLILGTKSHRRSFIVINREMLIGIFNKSILISISTAQLQDIYFLLIKNIL